MHSPVWPQEPYCMTDGSERWREGTDECFHPGEKFLSEVCVKLPNQLSFLSAHFSVWYQEHNAVCLSSIGYGSLAQGIVLLTMQQDLPPSVFCYQKNNCGGSSWGMAGRGVVGTRGSGDSRRPAMGKNEDFRVNPQSNEIKDFQGKFRCMGNLSILRSKSLQYFLGKPCSSCSKRSSESDKRCEDVHKRKDIVSGLLTVYEGIAGCRRDGFGKSTDVEHRPAEAALF
ncbi:hypothetical protein Anapl_03826 [Anas platyrhynchos]|uniref:Uncharacterized protein n=1 Tax=Anas platyrhynchos TaxID=8839 RepID=R0LAR9_ANAPL|nr:hypothetical protein Anapl_03826 [Anas platyrhynchos]